MPQGANFAMNVAVQNTDGTIKDLTGYDARLQVRSEVASEVVLMEASTANDYITVDGPEGVVRILVPADVTAVMTWTSGVYDLEVFTTAANRLRPMKGFAYLDLAVSRDALP